MAVAPTGIESLPLKYLAELLAASTTFQSWVGAGSEGAAMASIHYAGVTDPASLIRPYAIVSFVQDGFHLTKQAGGTGSSFGVSGDVGLILFADVDTAQSIDDQVLTFANTTGAILAEMAQAAGTGGRFDFTVCDGSGPMLSDEDEHADQPDSVEAVYVFRYAGAVTQ